MAITREKKQEQLQVLIEKMQKAKSVVFAKYSETTVANQNKVRNALRAQHAELKVAKKTLIRLAAKSLGIENIPDEALAGQIAVAFSYEDATAGAQILKKLSREIPEISLIGGLFEGKALGTAEIKELADLPSREVLLAKLLGSMLSPVSGFVGVGSGIISSFVRVLDGQRKKLEA